MKIMKKILSFIIFSIFFFLPLSFSAQNAEDGKSARISQEQQSLNKQKEFNNPPKSVSSNRNTESASVTPGIPRRIFPFKRSLNKDQKKRLAVESADLNGYAAFLEQPKTGLIKLFPDLGCEKNANIIRVDQECLNWIPNSAFFSFREREHTSEILADIRLEKNYLISDGILSQGILVALGDVSLENVTLDTAGINFLINYQPEQNHRNAAKQILQLNKGIESDRFHYQRVLPVVADTTYALRVVAYRGKVIQTFRRFIFNLLEGDDRTDLTLVFRIVKKSADGSLNLLWKELQRKNAPKLIYEKRKR